MSISENPSKIGGWAIGGIMGAANIITSLADEGYAYTEEEKGKVRVFAHELLAAIGDDVPDPTAPSRATVKEWAEELGAYKRRFGMLQ